MLDPFRRTSFDAKAEQYDAVRPSYPPALVAAILERTGARRVLEIGAGTGQATRRFAEAGCTITAVEPGPHLAARLRANLAGFPVTVEEMPFEAFAGTGFDLVYAAQSFHWIEPDVRFARAAAIAPWLALITNEHRAFGEPLRSAFEAAYARYMPSDNWHDSSLEKARASWVAEIDACGLYGPVHVEEVPWSRTYTRSQYLALIDTYSQHSALAAEQKQPLFEAVGAAIDAQGGSIEIPYVSLALVAHTR